MDESPQAANRRSKRQKVDHACVYCRRSHMTCDSQRPCSRCVKRNIGHLCHDEPRPSKKQEPGQSGKGIKSEPNNNTNGNDYNENNNDNATNNNNSSTLGVPTLPSSAAGIMDSNLLIPTSGTNGGAAFDWSSLGNQSILSQTSAFNQNPVFYSEHAGSEFSSLNDFLSMIDDPSLVGPPLDQTNTTTTTSLNSNTIPAPSSSTGEDINTTTATSAPTTNPVVAAVSREQSRDPSAGELSTTSSDAKKDKFFLTAADPSEDISPEERLKQVIHAKVEAGLLQPFNYVKGYTRLQRYMDNYMNQSSKQRILKPLSIFRPAFRAVAQSLQDVDLVLVEEAFERMLLDYDRVFTSMAIPACLWRRTGEIYRGNKEFAGLVEVNVDDLRDGKLAIYELMSEESAVNYWEKYGNIAFDSGQKAVLTSCNLRTKDGRKRRACCFSFTVRRDRYNIPSCIVGNFIPIHP